MTKQEAINAVIAWHFSQVGYIEKASGNLTYLYDKTANSGSANYTYYGYEMHKIQPSNMDYPAAWCDAYVDCGMVKVFGVDIARKMLRDFDDYTVRSANLYKLAKRWYNVPQAGDQIFFLDSKGGICHTGIVYAVDSTYVYTVEGNTSGASGVVANGGGVAKKKYARGYARIAGYGRPDYELAAKLMTANEAPAITEYTNIDEIAWELNHLGIVSDKQGLIEEANQNLNGRLYWLARKLCHAARKLNGKAETVKVDTYTDIDAIAWDLNYRGLVTDFAGLIADVKAEPNGRLYWLARKGLDYLRKRD